MLASRALVVMALGVAGTSLGNEQARLDQNGVPLPPALVRMGTTRLRPGGLIDSLAFSPDGKVLCSPGHHGVFFWDSTTGKLVRRLHVPEAETTCLTTSADGKVLAALCAR